MCLKRQYPCKHSTVPNAKYIGLRLIIVEFLFNFIKNHSTVGTSNTFLIAEPAKEVSKICKVIVKTVINLKKFGKGTSG